MFLIAVVAVLVLGLALTALILVLVARPVMGGWLRYPAAFKAVVGAYALPVIATLFISDLRLSRILAGAYSTAGLVLLQMLLLVLGAMAFCKLPDGQRVGLLSATIVSVATTLTTSAMGWLTFKPASSLFLEPTVTDTRTSGDGSQLSARNKLCLRSLSLTLSDTGNGPDANEAHAYRERLDQEAKAKGGGLEQVLKSELSKLGSQVPFGCEHLK